MKVSINNRIKNLIIVGISSVLLFILIFTTYEVSGTNNIFKHSISDNYTYQAMAWREGKISVPYYKWIELAVINDEYFSTHDKRDPDAYQDYFFDINGNFIDYKENKYYMSFPPFPTVPMLFLSYIFGNETPNNLVSVLYCIGAFVFMILTCRRLGYSCILSICGASLVSIASSAYYLAVNAGPGSVWFQAQNLSLLLTTASFYLILCNKEKHYYFAYTLLAFAVGCRPFQIVYFFYFTYIVLKKYKFKFKKIIKFYISPAIIGSLYMIYNYVRFGNVLEFGHNYLPEMMLAPNGQFGFEYLTNNLKELFFKTGYEFQGIFHLGNFGFAFWISNVLFALVLISAIVAIVRFVNKSVKEKESRWIINSIYPEAFILMILMIIHFICIAMHKTLGLYQFGSRYTVDILPAALLFAGMILRPFFTANKSRYIRILSIPIQMFALIVLTGGIFINITGVYMILNGEVGYSIKNLTYLMYFQIILIIIYIIFKFIKEIRIKSKKPITT